MYFDTYLICVKARRYLLSTCCAWHVTLSTAYWSTYRTQHLQPFSRVKSKAENGIYIFKFDFSL